MTSSMSFGDSCIILLPGSGRVPRPIIEGILSALETVDKEAAPLIIIDPDILEGEVFASNDDGERITPQTVLLTLGGKIADRVIDGASVVIRDQYRDNRAAKDYILNKYSKPFWER